MSKKKLLILMGSVCLVFVLVALPFMTACPAPVPEKTSTPAPTPVPTAEEVYTAKFACTMPSTSFWGEHCRIAMRHWEAATHGKLQFEMYYVGELFKSGVDANKAVQTGAMDISFYNNMETIPVYLKTELLSIGAVYTTTEQFRCVEKTDAFKAYEEGFKEYGVINLATCSVIPPMYIWTAKKPIKTAEDWKGLKLRVAPARSWVNPIEALGASCITLDVAEALPAFATGLVDGCTTNVPTAVHTFKAGELLPYVTVGSGDEGFNPTCVLGFIANLEWWNNLPADIREAVMAQRPSIVDVTQTYLDGKAAACWDEYVNTPGVTVTRLDEEETKRWIKIAKEANAGLVAELGGEDLVAAGEKCAQ